MSDALERIISDAEITKHHFGNWPVMTPREVVNEGVLKYAHGFSSGHTQLQILLSHKLLKKPKPGSYRADLSEKGKKYARALYARRAEAAEAALVRALPTTAAERDVLTERSRQIVAEGWNASHDDAHAAGELSVAAACYALLSAGWSRVALWEIWPKGWGVDWLKDCDPRRAKVKAAALIIADIERLDRARRSGEASGGEP